MSSFLILSHLILPHFQYKYVYFMIVLVLYDTLLCTTSSHMRKNVNGEMHEHKKCVKPILLTFV